MRDFIISVLVSLSSEEVYYYETRSGNDIKKALEDKLHEEIRNLFEHIEITEVKEV